MARLTNDRNEQYARHRARGLMPAKASIAAGYAPGSSNTHLEKDAEIVARIGELQQEFKEKQQQQRTAATEAAKIVGQMTGVGRGWVIEKLAENAQNAARDGDYKESNAALELIGKEFGMFEGQKSGDDEGGSAIPQTLNMDALEGVLDAAQAELPGPAASTRPTDPALAMVLIEGQVSRRKPNHDEDVDGWSAVDPDTAPEDLIAMALGEKTIPDYDTLEHPRTPPRRRDNRVKAHERALTTGSETDVALLDDDDTDD